MAQRPRGRAQITIVDLTDSRQLVAYIGTSNQRQVIYDPDTNVYTPDYSKQTNKLTPELFIAGAAENQTEQAKSVKWFYRTNSLGDMVEITASDNNYTLGTDKSLTIKGNVLAAVRSMAYIVQIVYQDSVTEKDIKINADVELVKISNGSKGLSGAEALIGVLSNESQTIPTDDKGNNGNYFGAESDMMIYQGTKEVTSEWTIIATPSEGVTGTFTNGTYKVTNMTVDSGYVDFVGNKTGASVVEKRFNLTKVKAGEKGVDGKTPIKGADYFDGKDGQDGASSFLWVMYSQNSDGSGMVSDPTNAKYIGIATTQTNNKPANNNSYTWSLFRSEGIPGEPGEDGQTSYFHVKYSDNGTSFTANNGETLGTWIGVYVDFTEADSTVFSNYSWSKVKGEDGDDSTAYQLIIDKKAIKKDEKGVMTDGGKITLSALSQTGASAPKAYAGRFIVQEQETQGSTTWITKYTSAANESTATYTVTNKAVNVRVNLYLAGGVSNLIDSETVAIVSDGVTPLTLVITRPQGDIIKNGTGNLTAVANLYLGTEPVIGPTYKWYKMSSTGVGDADSGPGWIVLTAGAPNGTTGYTTSTLTITPAAIQSQSTFMVIVTYENRKYKDMISVADLTDPYDVVVMGPSTFKNSGGKVRLKAKVYQGGEEIDKEGKLGFDYIWYAYTSTGSLYPNFIFRGKEIEVLASDIDGIAQVLCDVNS